MFLFLTENDFKDEFQKHFCLFWKALVWRLQRSKSHQHSLFQWRSQNRPMVRRGNRPP